MKHTICHALVLLSTLAVPLWPASVSAAPLVTANVGDNTGTSTPSQSQSSGSVSDAESGANSAGSTDGTAFASFGLLRAFGQSSAVNSNLIFSNSAASWKDDFFIDAPGLTGTFGKVKVRFMIDGSLSASSNGATPQNGFSLTESKGEAAYTFGVDPSFSDTKTETRRANGTSTGTPFLGIMQEVVLDFTYGQWLNDVTLRINARSQAYAENSGAFTASASANLANTATWEGFAEVLDAGNNVVTNYSFQSASGANYVQPIPEPGSATLLAATGLLFGLMRRKRCPRC